MERAENEKHASCCSIRTMGCLETKSLKMTSKYAAKTDDRMQTNKEEPHIHITMLLLRKHVFVILNKCFLILFIEASVHNLLTTISNKDIYIQDIIVILN